MKLLVTGISGFVGSILSKGLLDHFPDIKITGIDNLSRKGAEINLPMLTKAGINLIRGDLRNYSDLDSIGEVDWVIDCAANPSVLAGLNEKVSSRQVMEHNLLGTINLLEYCKKYKAGLILLSTSRVYSAQALADIPVKSSNERFHTGKAEITGFSELGISEQFPTTAPISLYGASKLASEQLILEYSHAFDFPVWINRCGVLAGARQFGKADQGIYSYWIHSFKEKNL